MMNPIIIALFSLSLSAADSKIRSVENLGSSSPLEAFATIKIESFDATSTTFNVSSVRHPGEGFSAASPKALSISIPELREELLIKNPQHYIGKKFVLSKKLANFTPEELKARGKGKGR